MGAGSWGIASTSSSRCLLLAGIGWLTASAYIEDHRAKWTDPAQFAEIEKQIGNSEAMKRGSKNSSTATRRRSPNFTAKRAFEKYQKSEDYLNAVARADEDAERVGTRERPQRIPPTGALSMLREDSKTQGGPLPRTVRLPQLFQSGFAGGSDGIQEKPRRRTSTASPAALARALPRSEANQRPAVLGQNGRSKTGNEIWSSLSPTRSPTRKSGSRKK